MATKRKASDVKNKAAKPQAKADPKTEKIAEKVESGELTNAAQAPGSIVEQESHRVTPEEHAKAQQGTVRNAAAVAGENLLPSPPIREIPADAVEAKRKPAKRRAPAPEDQKERNDVSTFDPVEQAQAEAKRASATHAQDQYEKQRRREPSKEKQEKRQREISDASLEAVDKKRVKLLAKPTLGHIQVGPGSSEVLVNDPARIHNEQRGETGIRNAKYGDIAGSHRRADQSQRSVINHVETEI